jgi:putative ABC transport system permease protein
MVPISYNIRSMVARKWTTLATVAGIMLVVFVMAAALMFLAGLNSVLKSSGRADNAVILRKGSDAELASGVEDPMVGQILSRDEVLRTAASSTTGLGVGEIVVVITLDKKGTDGVSNATIRGVPPNVMEFRPEVKIVDGRPPKPGTDEVMIGQQIRGRFAGVDLNQSFELRKNRPVQVVGVFSADGSAFESEIWADVVTVRSAYNREGVVSSVRARLASPSKFDAFKAGVESDQRLGLEVLRETEFYEKQAGMTGLLGYLGIGAAILFSLGAMIGAAITMNAAVANRQREIGILRALGFSRFSILTSFILEALVVSFAGCVAGIVAAMFMTLFSISTMNWATWSELVIRFNITPGIIIFSVVFAVIMGLIGGLFPAIRAARVSPLEAMRA